MQYSVTYREKDGGIQVIVRYKDDSGRWRQKAKQGIKTKKLAKLEADKIIDYLKSNISFLNNDYSNYTIGQLKDEYLNYIKIHREHFTYMNYSTALEHYKDIFNIKINALVLNDIQKCIDEMVKKNLSWNTLDRWSTIFKCFIKWVKIQYNVKVPELYGLTIPAKKCVKHVKKAINKNEIDQIINFFKNRTNYSLDYYISVLLAGKAGMRIGEISGLTWDNIDFNAKLIKVEYQWKYLKGSEQWGFGDLKSKNSYRTIPISSNLCDALKDIKQISKINNMHRLISSQTTRSLTVNLDKVLKRKYNITIHELRHSYTTLLVQNNLDFKTIAYLIGDDVEQVLKTYSHVNSDMMYNAKNIIESIN